MDHQKRFIKGGGDFWGVEGFVENVAIEAPVAAEDDEDAFVGSGGGAKSFGDFLIGVHVLWIDFLIFERLAEAGGGGMLCGDQMPLAGLLEPGLGHGHELFFQGGALFGGEGELDGDGVNVGALVILLDDLSGEVGEALGFQGGPEGNFIGESDGFLAGAGDFRGRGIGVEGGDGGGVAGENGGAPLVEGREGLLGAGSGG